MGRPWEQLSKADVIAVLEDAVERPVLPLVREREDGHDLSVTPLYWSLHRMLRALLADEGEAEDAEAVLGTWWTW